MLGWDIFQFSGSMLLIYFSADLIVRYGKEIAISLGVSRYIIGLTLIAFGTSFPELVVNVNASIIKESGIVFGNIIGSNIANIALVLSSCAVIKYIKTDKVEKKDLIFFVLSAVFTFLIAIDGQIKVFEGFLLLLGFILYCYSIKKSINDFSDDKSEIKKKYKVNFYALVIVTCAFFTLIAGSNLFIDSAISLAKRFNVSTLTISVTLVAIGTSLPELATSIIAIIKKEYDLLIGNIIGSNIMNLLMVLGSSAVINSIVVDIDYTSLTLMISLTFLILAFNIFRIRISRIFGLVLLIIYIVFIYSNFNNIA